MFFNRILISLVGCMLLVSSGCKQHDQEEAVKLPPAAQVRVIAVATQAAEGQHEVAGTVEAVRRATIAAKVTGTIEEMPVVLGSVVKKDALLVKISAGEIAAQMEQAKAQLEQARRNFEREKRLLAKDASTRETVKNMEDLYRVAEAGYREAKTMLGYTTITAPFDGMVSQKIANAGDLALPGMPLLVLENNRQLQVIAEVPEAFVTNINEGDSLPVSVPSADFKATGVVAEIAPSADATSRTFTVKININGATALRPGQYVRVSLPGDAAACTFWVPETAVSRFGQMERLFVVQDATASLRLVRTGDHRNGQVEILSGVNAGEQVVVQGGGQLVDGQPVHIVP